jgi:hypothetical protein
MRIYYTLRDFQMTLRMVTMDFGVPFDSSCMFVRHDRHDLAKFNMKSLHGLRCNTPPAKCIIGVTVSTVMTDHMTYVLNRSSLNEWLNDASKSTYLKHQIHIPPATLEIIFAFQQELANFKSVYCCRRARTGSSVDGSERECCMLWRECVTSLYNPCVLLT